MNMPIMDYIFMFLAQTLGLSVHIKMLAYDIILLVTSLTCMMLFVKLKLDMNEA